MSGGFDFWLLLVLFDNLGIDVFGVILIYEDEFFGVDGIYGEWIVKKVGILVKRIFLNFDFFLFVIYLDYLVMNEVVILSLFLFIF